MKPDGGVWQVLSPPCAGDLRWDEKGNSVSECGLEPRCVFDSLEAANLSPWSVHINPPRCVLILHIIALCSCLGQQFTVFLVDKLVLCGPQVQVITPLLLGCSRPSTSSVGTDAYRQKAILSTSYQAVTETSEASDCKDDSFGQYNHFFAHTKIAEMIQDHTVIGWDAQGWQVSGELD